MIGTVLAAGLSRWEKDPLTGAYRLKEEGDIWMLVSDPRQETHIILKPEVADWCFENIGAYRIVERFYANEDGPLPEDCWWIEFQSDRDGVHFKLRWL